MPLGRQMCTLGTVIMTITTVKPSLGQNRTKPNDYQCIYSHVRLFTHTLIHTYVIQMLIQAYVTQTLIHAYVIQTFIHTYVIQTFIHTYVIQMQSKKNPFFAPSPPRRRAVWAQLQHVTVTSNVSYLTSDAWILWDFGQTAGERIHVSSPLSLLSE